VTRPRLLDLFCGAGGASAGYAAAGFDVVGVDLEPHPDHPSRLIVADALEVLADAGFLAGFDVVHASPPCQAFTSMSNRWRGAGGAADAWPDLLDPVRDGLLSWGGPYVIENVVGARVRLRSPLLLHGGMFGLGVHRPRLFEVNWPAMIFAAPPPPNPVGVYGKAADGRRLNSRADGTEQRAARSLAEARAAMGIPWMTDFRDVAEAIPPAYTEFLGGQLVDYLSGGSRLGPAPLEEVGGALGPVAHGGHDPLGVAAGDGCPQVSAGVLVGAAGEPDGGRLEGLQGGELFGEGGYAVGAGVGHGVAPGRSRSLSASE
jgi:DNA (cytosine-5)-methyltransferase 1